ncbi:hypothetical protein VTK26DRAFT_4424 [Humicola hyalothermophila]
MQPREAEMQFREVHIRPLVLVPLASCVTGGVCRGRTLVGRKLQPVRRAGPGILEPPGPALHFPNRAKWKPRAGRLSGGIVYFPGQAIVVGEGDSRSPLKTTQASTDLRPYLIYLILAPIVACLHYLLHFDQTREPFVLVPLAWHGLVLLARRFNNYLASLG